MEEFINFHWPAIKAILKGAYDSNTSTINPDLIKGDPLYTRNLNHIEQIRPHVESNVFPERLFKHRYPNQTEQDFKYLKENFKNVTLPIWSDFINSIKRAINRSNYSVHYPKDFPNQLKDFPIRDYLEGGMPAYKNIHDFMGNIAVPAKLRDAMGVITVCPNDYPSILNDDGERVIDPNQLLEPTVKYIESPHVLAYEADEFVLILTHEKSVVSAVGGNKKIGLVLNYFDKNQIVRIAQKGRPSDWLFDMEVVFAHNSNFLPVFQLKGIPKQINGKTLYESPFLHACDNLDKVLTDDCNLELSKANMVYPYRAMYSQPCTHDIDGSACTRGVITLTSDEGVPKHLSCPKCNGAGVIESPKPGGTTYVNSEEPNEHGLEIMKFFSPPTDGLDFLERSIERNTNSARQLLHLHQTNEKAMPETATGKTIDQKSLHAFIRPISEDLFDIFDNILQAVTLQRYGPEVTPPTVKRPTEFDIKTAQDYMAEFRANSEANLPNIVLQGSFDKYIKSVFFNNQEQIQEIKLLSRADSLLLMPNDEVSLKVSRKAIQPWEEYLHDRGAYLIAELVATENDFYGKSISEQVEALQNLAKEQSPTVNNGVPSIEDLANEPAA